MRRRSVLALLAAATAGPAFAAEAKKPEALPDLDYVDISEVGLPVVVEGRVVNYVFVRLRLHLAPAGAQMGLSAKEPYFRDALIRAAHRTPFVVPNDANRIDETALKRTMLAEAARIAGPRAIASVEVLRQAPQRFVARRPAG